MLRAVPAARPLWRLGHIHPLLRLALPPSPPRSADTCGYASSSQWIGLMPSFPSSRPRT